jgi:DNA-binding GntR family transcriptional regulator
VSETTWPRTITSMLIAQLRDDIRSGRISPGTRLRQAEIAELFNVSTTPVREAFSALEREGLLVGNAHRGVLVFRPSVADLQETYEIRMPLEMLATELAVPNMDDAFVEHLRALIDRMAAAIDDPAGYGLLNEQFHSRIYARARRPKLERLISDLRHASAAYLQLYAESTPSSHETHDEHVRIVEACAAGDAQAAAHAMAAHLRHTVAFVSERLDASATD